MFKTVIRPTLNYISEVLKIKSTEAYSPLPMVKYVVRVLVILKVLIFLFSETHCFFKQTQSALNSKSMPAELLGWQMYEHTSTLHPPVLFTLNKHHLSVTAGGWQPKLLGCSLCSASELQPFPPSWNPFQNFGGGGGQWEGVIKKTINIKGLILQNTKCSPVGVEGAQHCTALDLP